MSRQIATLLLMIRRVTTLSHFRPFRHGSKNVPNNNVEVVTLLLGDMAMITYFKLNATSIIGYDRSIRMSTSTTLWTTRSLLRSVVFVSTVLILSIMMAMTTTTTTITTADGDGSYDGVKKIGSYVVSALAWSQLSQTTFPLRRRVSLLQQQQQQQIPSASPPRSQRSSSRKRRLKLSSSSSQQKTSTTILQQQQQQHHHHHYACIAMNSNSNSDVDVVAAAVRRNSKGDYDCGGSNNVNNGSSSSSREDFLKALLAATTMCTSSSISLLASLCGSPSPCRAAVTLSSLSLSSSSSSSSSPPLDAGEAVRRGAANIPGYGPTDIFYPLSMKGSWTMTRQVELYSSSQPTTNSKTTTTTSFTLTYPYRFIQSIENDAVVADRGFNQASLEQAIIDLTTAATTRSTTESQQLPSNNNSNNSNSNVRYEWAVNNPNDLRIELPNGSRKEIKVTKRATERNRQQPSAGDGEGGTTMIETITSSEFQRITQEEQQPRSTTRSSSSSSTSGGSVGGAGVPIASVSARRVVSKYKIISDNDDNNNNKTTTKVEGLEIVYDMGGADPLSVQSGIKSSQPTILSKSRIVLTR